MATDIAASIRIPDRLDTRIGTLAFVDGFPDPATVERVYDGLDFQRGVQAFLTCIPAVSQHAVRKALRTFGPDNHTVLLFESLMDSKTLFLSGNTDTVYAMAWLDLRNGPVVVESPPNTFGLVDDAWLRYVADLGNAGPDRGKGGKFLFVPPGHRDRLPSGHFVFHSRTFGNAFGARGFLVKGSTRPATEAFEKQLRIYPLSQARNAPPSNVVRVSGHSFNTIFPADLTYFEALDQIVQEEPLESSDAETLGLLAALGIRKGRPFAPEPRMRRILAEAAAVGHATARALAYRPRIDDAYLYPNSSWITPFAGGSYEFAPGGVPLLDARTLFFFIATGITPAMTSKMVGSGSQYAAAFVDSRDRPLDGRNTYRLHLPPEVPAKIFWSVTAYDVQTRSQLQTHQRLPSVGSQTGVVLSHDRSVDIFFGPRPPAGQDHNWVQTVPGKGWFAALRLYGPREAWFDKSWRPSDLEELEP
jgi:hypothetical protein